MIRGFGCIRKQKTRSTCANKHSDNGCCLVENENKLHEFNEFRLHEYLLCNDWVTTLITKKYNTRGWG